MHFEGCGLEGHYGADAGSCYGEHRVVRSGEVGTGVGGRGGFLRAFSHIFTGQSAPSDRSNRLKRGITISTKIINKTVLVSPLKLSCLALLRLESSAIGSLFRPGKSHILRMHLSCSSY